MAERNSWDTSERDRNPEDWRQRREFNQGYGEHEYGNDRRQFQSGERENIRSEYIKPSGGSDRGEGFRNDRDYGRSASGSQWSGSQGWGGGQGSWGSGPGGSGPGGIPDHERHERFGEARRDSPEQGGNAGRWDRDDPGWQGRQGYRNQNEWAAAHGPWSDPGRTGQQEPGRYAEGGRYYGEAPDAARTRHESFDNGPHRGRGPKGYRRSDDRIREDVCERLTHDSWLDASNIEIDVREGEVTLTGSVDNRQAKRRAEDIIENVPGLRDIHNQLRVDAGALQGQNTTAVTTTPHRDAETRTGSGRDAGREPGTSTGRQDSPPRAA